MIRTTLEYVDEGVLGERDDEWGDEVRDVGSVNNHDD